MKTISEMLDAGKLDAIWFGSPDWLAYVRSGMKRRAFYCPYPISLPLWNGKRTLTGFRTNVSLFGPLPPRKNVGLQAMAAKLANCTLHITDDRAKGILRSVGVEFVSHGWLPSDQYVQLLGLMDLGLQVSISGAESFSFVAWDHISRDIPCLSATDWVPEEMHVEPSGCWPELLAKRIITFPTYPPGHWRSWAEQFAEQTNAKVKEILRKELDIRL